MLTSHPLKQCMKQYHIILLLDYQLLDSPFKLSHIPF